MIELRLDRKSAELMEKGGASISFPLRVNMHGDPSTAVVCGDVGELIAYKLKHHDSPFPPNVLAEYVRNFCEPLAMRRSRVAGGGDMFEAMGYVL